MQSTLSQILKGVYNCWERYDENYSIFININYDLNHGIAKIATSSIAHIGSNLLCIALEKYYSASYYPIQHAVCRAAIHWGTKELAKITCKPSIDSFLHL